MLAGSTIPRPSVLRLPVVRTLAQPPTGPLLVLEEGPDLLAALAVACVALLGLALGGAAMVQEWVQPVSRVPVLAGAALLAVVCTGALLAGVAELAWRRRVEVGDGEVRCQERALAGGGSWTEPLSAYEGLTVMNRQRRLFVRNQDRPPTGRRGPVTEFVIVLRHRARRERDLELHRAQPSLTTLRTMHALNAGAGAGTARALAAGACEERARGYRDALLALADRLQLPVLLPVREGEPPVTVDGGRLGIWLDPSARDDATELKA